MRVLVFVDRVKLYGAERVAWTLAEGLSRQHEVMMVTFSRQAPQDVAAAPFRYLRVGQSNGSNALQALTTVWELRRQARQADVIISFMPLANFLACIATLGLSTKNIVTEHNAPSRTGRSSGPRGRLQRLLQAGFYRLATAIVTVSDAVRDDLAEFAWLRREQISRIYNPLDYGQIVARSLDPLPVAPKTIDGGRRILMVGRLKPAKGHAYAIRAMAKLPPNFSLYLVGDGELEGELRRLADLLGLSDRIHFLGFQENPYSWMRWAHVLLVPSLYEGFGLVVAEAAAVGTPVVTSDDPALAEVAALTGAIVVARGDTEALGRACIDLTEAENPMAVRVPEFQTENVVVQYSEQLKKAVADA